MTGPVIYPPQPITFQQYMEEEPVKRRYDIVNGVRVFAVPPSLRHQDIVGNLLAPFHDYAKIYGYAILFSLFDVLISWEPFCTRQPDVMLVGEGSMQKHEDGEPLLAAPEMVVEIVSSIDCELALDNKLREYCAIGVQECWVVDPEQRTVEVVRLSDRVQVLQTYGGGQTIVSMVCQGLYVQVDDILAD